MTVGNIDYVSASDYDALLAAMREAVEILTRGSISDELRVEGALSRLRKEVGDAE